MNTAATAARSTPAKLATATPAVCDCVKLGSVRDTAEGCVDDSVDSEIEVDAFDALPIGLTEDSVRLDKAIVTTNVAVSVADTR